MAVLAALTAASAQGFTTSVAPFAAPVGGEYEIDHELPKSTTSQPEVGGPLNRGSFVSRYILGDDGSVESGERAYDDVYAENSFVGPAADEPNATPGFGRFCSGSFVGRRLFGRDTWLIDAQAHSPTPAPFPNTVEDGQLLLMR